MGPPLRVKNRLPPISGPTALLGSRPFLRGFVAIIISPYYSYGYSFLVLASWRDTLRQLRAWETEIERQHNFKQVAFRFCFPLPLTQQGLQAA